MMIRFKKRSYPVTERTIDHDDAIFFLFVINHFNIPLGIGKKLMCNYEVEEK